MLKLDEVFTAVGTPNIALVKYWGKRNDKLNLPANSSLSMTLDESLATRTSVLFSKKLKEDALYINGERQQTRGGTEEKVLFTMGVLDAMRAQAGTKAHCLVVSRNAFPTGAGLASSAAGAATLVFVLSKALGLKSSSMRDLSVLARRISGSGCRSLFGGFVKWDRGSRRDGLDSYAEQVADSRHWPDIVDVIAIVAGGRKKVPTAEGHARTVATSRLFTQRPVVAEANFRGAVNAVEDRDFATLSTIVMRDSNNMHATCMDAYPPIMYLNDKSREIIEAVHLLNESEGRQIAAYTFDAGPNAHIITRKGDAVKVRAVVERIVGRENIILAGQGEGPRVVNDRKPLIDGEAMAPI